MRLSQGDNHQISARDGIASETVWSRPDLTPEDGARNARQMSTTWRRTCCVSAPQYRGIIFIGGRGATSRSETREPGPFFSAAAKAHIGVAVAGGESAIQLLQFRNLCRDAAGAPTVFDNEPDALRFSGRPTLAAVARQRVDSNPLPS